MAGFFITYTSSKLIYEEELPLSRKKCSKMSLKLNRPLKDLKTPYGRPSIGVVRSGLMGFCKRLAVKTERNRLVTSLSPFILCCPDLPVFPIARVNEQVSRINIIGYTGIADF